MTRLIPIALSWFLLFGFQQALSQPFTATVGSSDSYIDVEWDLDQACFEDASNNDEAYEEGVFLELIADGEVIYTEIIDDAVPSAVNNVYRHFVGPGQSINYELILYEIGPGDEISVMNCSSLTFTGTTLAFQPPTGVSASDATRVDAIEIEWTNKSELSSSFQVIRKVGAEEVTVAVIPGTTILDSTFTYVDDFVLNAPQSLVNGVEYTYCIRTYSALTDSVFSEVEFPTVQDLGSTYAIGLAATDFTFTDQVDLTWNDISAFADDIVLRRNDDVFATFEDNTTVSATDDSPTYGLNSNYALDILDEEGVIIVRATDNGGVDANGQISGFVRNSDGLGIDGVNVKFIVEVLDTTIQDSVLTDFTGFYSFEDVFYGRSANFSLSAERGDASITPALLEVTLSNDQPSVSDADFLYRTALSPSEDSIAINAFTPAFGADRIDFTWDYFSTADTTQFLLFREGELLGSTNSTVSPLELADLTGKPNHFYIYELKAYALKNDSFVVASVRDTFQFPAVPTPTNLVIDENFDANTNGILTLSWTHSSDNFDGFQIYRNDSLIAVLDTSMTAFSDYTGVPGATYDYKVSAFRFFTGPVLGDELFESAFLSSDGNVYPAFVEATNITAVQQANNNAMLISWDIPGAFSDIDNFTGFKIYRDGVEIGEVYKGDDYEFLDLQGIPGSSVTYELRTFLLQLDTTYFSGPSQASPNPATFPSIATPSISSVNTATGKATIVLDGAYNTANRNYDGYILYADGVPFDTLQPHETERAFYPNINGATTSVSFDVRAYRNINGNFFVSAAANSVANIPLQNEVLEEPGNFNASETFPMHVALTWTYPVFKLSEFVVRRGGVILDTLPTTARAYYDYDTGVGVTEEYSVTAIYEGASSIPVYDIGRKRNTSTIFAYVFNDQNGRNLDSLQVSLEGGGLYFGQAYTNKAGLAIFENLPVDNTTITAINLLEQGRSVAVTANPLVNMTTPIENTSLT
ncbi:MAG: carboxypeptidase regulatory-like domain-containing protein, partial [Phaeodactylibacter sp.]|nr:carboxypeptidase regulatory-like domain-containing protein [Phaeodactylibacter sp.]